MLLQMPARLKVTEVTLVSIAINQFTNELVYRLSNKEYDVTSYEFSQFIVFCHKHNNFTMYETQHLCQYRT